MKKSKFLKPFSFASLALLMGIAGTMAFAPLGANPNNLANASEMVDQINTKADGENIKYAPSALGLDPENDPVIYTTESGLEIKYGGLDLNASLGSGPLKGYPYLTMGTYSSKAVNWIIIGRNSNVTTFNNAIQNYLFSTWKNKTSATYNKYFFGNTYETTTPAGSAINTDVASKSYIRDFEKISLSSITTNSEIPSGCVLVISEYVLTSSAFNNSGTYQGSTLKSVIDNLYTTNLSLTTSQKSLIQSMTLKTWSHGSLKTNTGCYMFPLACQKYNTDSGYYPNMNENFSIGDYLTSNALRVSYTLGTTTAKRWWYRSGHDSTSGYATFCDTNGAYWYGHATQTPHYATNSQGVRPACVIKLA